ncbi:cytidine deaminase [Erythrobacter arachoides]|uniref:Cytidine deaminase n=1 Tax=Aurantiacibacter arachoides TaxID=1850444 RepID=A0A845A1M8_9SPHN|nr:cytidine deaminase [Aurantiacibacter arachoides]MXO92857.1 cytidine deaminase [Aurantiacibacter arachoides]GGD53927.1 cytidine deaminase [Aurantiacibacter arachoides]
MSGDALVKAALAARDRAHAPYSRFHVGCAVESLNGEVAVGANMENACYRLGICAEQSALAAAQQAFGLENVARLVVVGGFADAGEDIGEAVMPCGGCRQAIAEAAQLSGRNITVTCHDHRGRNAVSTDIASLLPAAFSL